jgi:hypothetical protein
MEEVADMDGTVDLRALLEVATTALRSVHKVLEAGQPQLEATQLALALWLYLRATPRAIPKPPDLGA